MAPYAPSSPLFAHEDLLEVHDAVDWLSLMTYDYSTAQRPGPSAPLGWMEKSVKALLGETFALGGPVAAKVLLGLNFYGQVSARLCGSARMRLSLRVVDYRRTLAAARPK